MNEYLDDTSDIYLDRKTVEIGYCGNCGNFAIALKEIIGGELFYISEPPSRCMVHVYLLKDDRPIDITGIWQNKVEFIKGMRKSMFLNNIVENYKTSEEEITNKLLKTNKYTISKCKEFIKKNIIVYSFSSCSH